MPPKNDTLSRKPEISDDPAGLRRRAEARLRHQHNGSRAAVRSQKSRANAERAFHELEVHQIELEMQNAELQKVRNELEIALEKYRDLYDFAPVGYFSIDEAGVIREVNLTGSALLGRERSRIVNGLLLPFVTPATKPVVRAFLQRVFSGTCKQACEAELLVGERRSFWASFHSTPVISPNAPKWCRVAISDITFLKQAEKAQSRIEALAISNRELKQEIVRRQAVEKTLQKSEQHQTELFEQSRQMQEQLRHLSRQVLQAQED